MNGIEHRASSLLIALLLIITSLNPLIDNVFAEPGYTNDTNPTYIPEDGVQGDNGTKVKVKDSNISKDKTINLLHNTWSYNNTSTEVQINVTGDRVQLIIIHPDVGNVTLDMNFTYGKGKTFTKTKDKEKISYKTSDLNLTFSANTSIFKEIIVVEKEKDKLFPLNWTVNVTSEWDMNISRNNRTIQVGGVDVFWLQAFTAINVTNGTIALNETYSGNASAFNISLTLGQVVNKDDYPLTIDPTVTIDVTDAVDIDTRNIAVDSSGTMYTVYYDGTRVEYQSSTDSGQSWGSETTVHTAATLKQQIMCVDSNDNLHFAWKTTPGAGYHKVYWVGNSTWGGPYLFRPQIGSWQTFLPDGSGNVYIFFGEYTGGSSPSDTNMRKWDGDSWGTMSTIHNGVTVDDQRHEAVISSNGTLHLVAQVYNTGTGLNGVVYWRSTDGGSSWGGPEWLKTSNAFQPTIAVDSNDDIHISYMGKDGHAQFQIVYIKYNATGDSWGSETYITNTSATTFRHPTIATDQNDTIYLIWCNAGAGGAVNDLIEYTYSVDYGATWASCSTLLDTTYESRHPQALHYAYPGSVGNIPASGFMFAYKEDYTGTPDHTIFYSSNWSRVTDANPLSISAEYPENNGFAPTQPWAHALVAHLEGGQFNVTFSENSTGSWIDRQSNNTVTNGTFWWQFTQASSVETAYYWRVAAENGTDELNYTYKVTTAMSVNLTGPQITNQSLFRYSLGSVIDNYDLLNDTSNYTAILLPYVESSGWISNGAGDITKVGDTWYISHRQRTGDTDRGHYLCVDSSTDLINWTEIVNVSTSAVSPLNPTSFERSAIRFYEGNFFLYFCYDAGTVWSSEFVKSVTASGLEDQLLNSNNWTTIKGGAKDPTTFLHNGTYYFLNSDGLYEDDNPEGSSISFIVDFTQLYINTWGGPCGNNTGTIMFDNTSGYFIYWRGAKVAWDDAAQNDEIWYFAVSGDLENWEGADRHLKILNYTEGSGTVRYPSYFVTENETVAILEWEDDIGSGNRSIVLWVYDEGPASNDPPEFSSESPSNESIGISLQPWCSIQVNDTENDTIVVNFYENSTGSWVYRQTNNSVIEAPDWSNNGTYWWQFTQASVQITQYWWNVTADDGTVNISTTYTFTTNEASAQSNPYPSNESTGISIQPWCNITVNDLEGDSMTVRWYENTTGPYVLRQTNSSASNGTYWWQYTQASVYSTLYYWRVDVLDGEFNTSIIYEFTTGAENSPPEFSSEFPTNTTTGVALQPWCYVTIEDPEGDTFNVTWYENSTASWVQRQQNLTVTNGTFWWQFTQASSYSTTYYWKLVANDTESNENVIIYHFTTLGNTPPVGSSPSPPNGSLGISLTPTCRITVSDINGDSMNISWLENTTGPWVERHANVGISDGTYSFQFTQFNAYSIIYYWRINITDETDNVTYIFHFTTMNNIAPTIGSPIPSNESIGISVSPTTSITIGDLDEMIVDWLEWNGYAWVLVQRSANLTSGTYNRVYLNATVEGTIYYWMINVTDGTLNTTETYHFTIEVDVDQWDSIYQVMLWAIVLVIVVGLFNVIRRFGYQTVRDIT